MRIVSLKRSLLLVGFLFLPTAALAQTPPPPPVTGYMIQIRQGVTTVAQLATTSKDWTCGLAKVSAATAPLSDPTKIRFDDPATPGALDCETSQPAFFRSVAPGDGYTGWVAPMSDQVAGVGMGDFVLGIPSFRVTPIYGPFVPLTGVRLLK